MTKFVTRTFLYLAVFISFLQAEDRIPFYEEFIDSGDLAGYLEIANQYLDENPEAKEAPRLALDLMMMGKAAEDLDSHRARDRSFTFPIPRIAPQSSLHQFFRQRVPPPHPIIKNKTE